MIRLFSGNMNWGAWSVQLRWDPLSTSALKISLFQADGLFDGDFIHIFTLTR